MWRSRPQDPLATTASPAMVRTATFNRGFVTSTGTAQGSAYGAFALARIAARPVASCAIR